jgi:RsiW-degrading membrane proteinase PrsW (M82 family)
MSQPNPYGQPGAGTAGMPNEYGAQDQYGAQALAPPTAGAVAVGTPGPMYTPRRRRTTARIVLLVVVIAVLAVTGLVTYGIVGFSLGAEVFAISLVLALVPVPFVVLSLLWLDRYEPEPWRYLVFAFAFGACTATLVALAINTGADFVIGQVTGQEENPLTAILVAPPVEEIGKAIPLLLLVIFRRKEINGIVDGIVYAGMAAVGFAFTENILYFGSAYVTAEEVSPNSGPVSVILTFVIRAVISPFAHPLFTCLTGIGLGLAARSNKRWVMILAPLGGLLLAMLLHGTWNLLASVGPLGIFIGYPLVMVPAFAAVVALAIWIRSSEGQVASKILPAYAAAGWISPPEIATLASMGGRLAARRWANSVAGTAGKRAMREFQYVATKLALLRDGHLRGINDANYDADERDLLSRLKAQRDVFLRFGPYGAAPPPNWMPGYRPPPPPWAGGPPMPGQPMPGQLMPGQPMPGQPMPGQPMPGQPGMGQPGMGQPGMGQPAGVGYPPSQPNPYQQPQDSPYRPY